jgi:hypothetical protein
LDLRRGEKRLFIVYWQHGSCYSRIKLHITKGETSKVYFIDDILYNEKLQNELQQTYLCMDSKGLFTYVSMDDLPTLIAYAQEGILSLSSEYIDQITKLNDNSNPIILYYEFKK